MTHSTTRHWTHGSVWQLAFFCTVSACGGGDSTTPAANDTGIESSVDMGTDAGQETGDTGPVDTGMCGPDADAEECGDGSVACGWKEFDERLNRGSVDRVFFDPGVAGRAFALTGQRLLRTTDSGATWTTIAVMPASTRELSFVAGEPDVLYFATSDGVARSKDAGVHIDRLSLEGIGVADVVTLPGSDRVLLAGVGFDLLRSTDGGGTWNARPVPSAHYRAIASHPTTPAVVLAAGVRVNSADTPVSGVMLRSIDGGVTFDEVAVTGLPPVTRLRLCQTDPNIVYAGTGVYPTDGSLWKSTDAGVSWTKLAGLPAGQQAEGLVVADDCKSVTVSISGFVSGGAGIYSSNDGGATWTGPHNVGLEIDEFHVIDMTLDSRTPSNLLLAARSGLYRSTDNANKWSVAPSGPLTAAQVIHAAPAAPTQLWLCSYGEGLWHRKLSESGWTRVPFTALAQDYVSGVATLPSDASHVFALGNPSYSSTDGGTTWTAMTTTGVNASAMAFHPTDPKVMYAVGAGGVVRSADGGKTWELRRTGLVAGPLGYVDGSVVLVDADTPTTIYAGTSAGVFRSLDEGSSWERFGLDGIPVAFLERVGTPAHLWAATPEGVFHNDTLTASAWTAANAGLESLDVSSFAHDATTGRYFVSTSRGVATSNDGSTWTALDQACLAVPTARSLTLVGAGVDRRLAVVLSGWGVMTRTIP